VNQSAARNVYFELTEAFTARAPNVAPASGQAVVYYRIAIMSKDGDWIIREAPDACDAVLAELDGRGARYRAAAPGLAVTSLPKIGCATGTAIFDSVFEKLLFVNTAALLVVSRSRPCVHFEDRLTHFFHLSCQFTAIVMAAGATSGVTLLTRNR